MDYSQYYGLYITAVAVLGVVLYVVFNRKSKDVAPEPVAPPQGVGEGSAVEHPLKPVVDAMLSSADLHLKEAQKNDETNPDKATEHYVEAFHLQTAAQTVLKQITKDEKDVNG